MNLIFDLDGTLIDSEVGIRKAVRAAAAECGLDLPTGTLHRHIGPPIDKMAQTIWPGISAAQASTIAQGFRKHYDGRYCLEAPLFPGAIETIHLLGKSGHSVFLATNKPTRPTHAILARHAMRDCFAEVICIDSSPNARFTDKSDMLVHLLSQCSLKASACIYIGDTPSDRVAARHAGMQFVGVAYGYGTLTPTDGDLGLARSVPEITMIIDRSRPSAP